MRALHFTYVSVSETKVVSHGNFVYCGIGMYASNVYRLTCRITAELLGRSRNLRDAIATGRVGSVPKECENEAYRLIRKLEEL